MSKKTPKQDVSFVYDELRKHLDYRFENNIQWVPRKENGTIKGVESYWMYFRERRFLRFDIYHSLSSEEAYAKTNKYLLWITEKHYSMTPFVGYLTKDGGVELFLYRKGPSMSPIDVDHFVSLIWSFYRQDELKEGSKERNRSLRSYLQGIHKIINDSSSLNDTQKQKLFEVFTEDSLNYSLESDIVCLKAESECKFFQSLLPKQGECDFKSLCRYTSVNSLFRILNERKVSMLSIVCMNDASECSYVRDYLKERECNDLDNTWIENNRFFIVSCSDIKESDDLMMWNMYGGKAEGVCIEYAFDSKALDDKTGFALARISYGEAKNKHASLDFIVEILKSSVDGKKFTLQLLGTWQHFFKAYEYHKENEIRLLFEATPNQDTKWILTTDNIMTPIHEFSLHDDNIPRGLPYFPLKMTKIIIGPKAKNQDALLSQVQAMLYLHKCQDSNCDVVPSTIDSFR